MAIIYVQQGATGNGLSWGNAFAFGDLQDAIAAANSGDEIWVAAGTYKPGTNRTSTFTLKNGVEIYGGFAGTEANRDDRNVEANISILSGDIGTENNASDNVYHVVTGTGSIVAPITNATILDGFTISDGNANGTGSGEGNGGAIFLSNANPTLSNLIFRNNNGVNGGAISNQNGSNPILIDTLFEYNTATNGAAIYNDLSSPQVTNGTFRLNVALDSGGALYNTGSSNPTLVNTIFSRNSANTGDGGAIFNNLSNASLTNSSLSNNVAVDGGGIFNFSSTTTLRNSIVWDNQDSSNTGIQILNSGGTVNLSNSIVQNGEFGGTNIDPLFVNASADDLRLKSGSPGLDAGNVNLLPGDSQDLDGDGNTTEKIPFDLSGNSRVVGANVDLGEIAELRFRTVTEQLPQQVTATSSKTDYLVV